MQVPFANFIVSQKVVILIKNLRRLRPSKIISIIRYGTKIFDIDFYLDSSTSKRNIILGYLYLFTKGIWSGRKINQHFDPHIYVKSFPQSNLKSSFPVLHYLLKSSGVNPITSFDRRYLSLNPDLMAFKGPLLYHFMKFKSIEDRRIAPETEMKNTRYAIKVALPQCASEYKLPFEKIDIEIFHNLKPNVSDTDSFDRKNQIQVCTSLKSTEFDGVETTHLDVASQIESDKIKIVIRANESLYFDIKWLRDLLMIYSTEGEFSNSEFTEALRFLLLSVLNRVPKNAELLGDKFPFSINDIQSDENIGQVTFSDQKFGVDDIRKKVGKKILLVSHEDSYTGAPLYLLQVAKYLRTEGAEVQVLCVRAKFKSGVFSNEGFHTFYVEDLSNQELLVRDWLLSNLGKELISDLLQQIAPFQIWVNSINASCVIELAHNLSMTSCLFVHESFGFVSVDYLANEYEMMFLDALEKANLVVFGSEYSKVSFHHKEIRSNGVVLNSLRMNDFKAEEWSIEIRNTRREELGIDPEGTVFLSMATFEPRKRIDDILKAFQNTKASNARLILVGYVDGDQYSNRIRTQAGGKSEVLVFPVTKDPSYFYSISDVLILASESETYPLVLQEAIHWDLLRIVSKFPGYSSSCDERSALMFEVGNIESLESLISVSSGDLHSRQNIKDFAKLDFLEKEEFYKQDLISIFRNLSLIRVSLEDVK